MHPDLTFLPGRFRIERARGRDYRTLERFHYRPRSPATWCQVWVVRYLAPGVRPRVVGTAVLSYPSPSSLPRRRVLHLRGSRNDELRYANRHVRTISRVIVHPQFRSLGLSSLLVRCICRHCDTRYVDAMAAMGRAHPLFARGGMRRVAPRSRRERAYFIFKRRCRSHSTRGGLR